MMVSMIILTTVTATAQWPMANGNAVGTCFSGSNAGANPAAFVMGTLDIRNVGSQPLDQNWSTVPMYHHPSWTASHLGEIFGVALDGSGNIYVTATVVYGGPTSTTNYPFGPAGPGGVYRVDGTTGMITTFASLPNTSAAGVPFASLGNICYDKDHNQFFVTNLDDGKIYRLDGTTGATLSTYDPFAADGGTPGFAPLGERLWGIAYRSDTVYFARWSRDNGNASGPQNTVWKIGLTGAGAFTGTEQLCFTMPATAPHAPISDMEFNTAGKLLLIQRTWYGTAATPLQSTAAIGGWAHASDMFRADFSAGTWTVSTTNYALGAFGSGLNAAGGCDWSWSGWNVQSNTPTGCDSLVWGSSDAIHFGASTGHTDFLYGWHSIPASGGGVAQGVVIDADGNTTTVDKSQIGDFDVMREVCKNDPAPVDCKEFRATVQLQGGGQGTPGCCAIFSIFNGSANTFTSVSATPLTGNIAISSASAGGGWSAMVSSGSAQYMPPTTYVPTGPTTGLQACFTTLAPGPYDIVVSVLAADGSICKDTVRVDCPFPAPTPPCMEIVKPEIKCVSENGTSRTYQYCFQITNLNPLSQAPFNIPMTSAAVYPTQMGVSVTPTSVTFPPLLYGQTSPTVCVTITVPVSAGLTQACLEMTPHGAPNPNGGYQGCCFADTFCIDLPPCKSCCEGFRMDVKEPKLTQSGSNINLSMNVTANPGPFRSFRATVVSAFKSNTCPPLGRTAIPVTITGGSVAGLPSPSFTPPSATALFGDVLSGVPMSNAPVSLTFGFPPPPSSFQCRDTVRFCVRYEFTDTTCQTCDTTICYTFIRKAVLIWHQTGTPKRLTSETAKAGDETQVLEAPIPQVASVTMESKSKATLTIELPDAGYSFASVRVATEGGVAITEMSEGTVADGMGFLGAIAAKSTKNVTVDLENTADLDAVKFYLTCIMVDAASQDSAVVPIELLGRTAEARTGDVLETDTETAKPSDVYTYALHFVAGNKTETPIKRVLIRTLEDAKILAAGPFSDDRAVMFRPDRVELKANMVPADNDDGSTLAPGADVRPIYLTVSGASGGQVKLAYTSYDSTGATVVEGQVELGSPISSVQIGEDGRPVDDVSMFAPSPNPASSMATITIRVLHAVPLTMRIVDLSGSTVITPLRGETLHAGDHGIVVDASSLPSGSYHVLLTSPSGTLRVPLVVRR